MALDPITGAEELLTTFVGKFIDNKTQAAAAVNEIIRLRDAGELSLAEKQLDINVEDAKSANWFQNSWRPALAWNCVIAYSYHFVIFPLLSFYVTMRDIAPADIPVLMSVLMVLIGARSWDKTKGVDSK